MATSLEAGSSSALAFFGGDVAQAQSASIQSARSGTGGAGAVGAAPLPVLLFAVRCSSVRGAGLGTRAAGFGASGAGLPPSITPNLLRRLPRTSFGVGVLPV